MLRTMTTPTAAFHDGQLEAIKALVEDRSRVLVVQRTGWGKSAVYFITTKILRESGSGPTILISPLLALMRNQIAMAARVGIRAATINSSNADDWGPIKAAIAEDAIDLLVVAPERFGNAEFQQEVMPTIAGRTGLIVIDEVHCISDWGHDFRPDYRRVKQILDRLPAGIPVVGTTATANNRVVGDVAEQLGSNLVLHRGGLARSGLKLHVLKLPRPAARLAWLVETLAQLPGTGIVYCLTVRDVLQVAEWLNMHEISAAAYYGKEESPAREQIESDLLANRVKVVVATSALGMGFDKPDLAFVIHYQSPGSPIAYYQQVGRAGRSLAQSWGILLGGQEDRDIQNYFIKSAFPSQALAEGVLGLLESRGGAVGRGVIESEINIGRSRLEQMMKVLEVEGAIERAPGGYRRTAAAWTYPRERVAGVTAARRREQEVMRTYGQTADCLMQFLGLQLDDPLAQPCGICMNCAGAQFAAEPDPALLREAQDFLGRQPIFINPRKEWPGGPGTRAGRIPKNQQLQTGRALSITGDGVWNVLIGNGAETLPEEVVKASARLIREWGPKPAPGWVCYIPSSSHPDRARDFALRLATKLGLPLHAVVERVSPGQPQREMSNSAQQYRNIAGAFRITPEVPAGPVLLVDDLVDSRWTLTVVGVALQEAGSGPVFPFTMASKGMT